MTPEQAQKFIARVLGHKRTEITGDDYKHLMLILRMLEPNEFSNNQRTWTDTYLYNGKKYDVTYGLEEEPILELVEDYEV